jgi:GT2 family glycosyltransferase
MKLSIIILNWNDKKVIADCLRSIYKGTNALDFEVIVSDNGSTDTSVEMIHREFPQTRVIENGANLRFAKGNNAAIAASRGEYVLILNPDTIIHRGSLEKFVTFADQHPEAGAFGCRVLNPDGSYQESGRPFPTLRGDWIAAFFLRPLAHLSSWFIADRYIGWNGDTVRTVDWQSGCCLLVRSQLLTQIGGFDEQFFYYYEDVDLCFRVWKAGYPILFTPDATIVHLGGQSTKERMPLGFELDKYVTRYRYYYKHYGVGGAKQCRRATLAWLYSRIVGLQIMRFLKLNTVPDDRIQRYRLAADWNLRVNPVRLVENGEEPQTSLRGGLRVAER